MKTIYIVTVNGKISSEAYNTLEEAQDFIKGRIDYNGVKSLKEPPSLKIECSWWRLALMVEADNWCAFQT
jgi:hypothetical protein